MRKTLTDKGVAALKPRPQRYAYPDPECRGHYVRVQPSGVKTYVTVARNPYGKQVWHTIGSADVMGIEDARAQAYGDRPHPKRIAGKRGAARSAGCVQSRCRDLAPASRRQREIADAAGDRALPG